MRKHELLWIDAKKLRMERGWLQREAAEKIGVTRAHLSALENGKRDISTKMITSLIRTFNVKLENFIIKGE